MLGLIHAPSGRTGVEEEADTLLVLRELPNYFASGSSGPGVSALNEFLTKKLLWSPEYVKRIVKRAESRLKEITAPEAEQCKVNILLKIERMLDACWTYKTGTGAVGEGTIFLNDPDTGEPLREINHAAIQGYLNQVIQMVGLKAPEKHEISVNISERPLAQLSDEQLQKLLRDQEMQRLKDAAIDAVPASPDAIT